MRKLPVPFFCIFAVLAFSGAAKKPPAFGLSLHLETNARDSEVFSMPVDVLQPPMRVVVEKIPMITQREVKAFYPGIETPSGFGSYFQLDPHGTKALEAMTTSHRDKFLVVIFNGRGVCRMRIDAPVRDGILYVPTGISSEELAQIAAQLPMINETPAEALQRQRAAR